MASAMFNALQGTDASALDLDDPAGLEELDRLPVGVARGGEFLDEGAFGRQRIAGHHLMAVDVGLDALEGVVDLVLPSRQTSHERRGYAGRDPMSRTAVRWQPIGY